ncbi:MAG: hypothetical protein K2P78_12400, partial [Gemmataceae bacterium]|nr:hypothetical protein [Gemmataceae bacterium]
AALTVKAAAARTGVTADTPPAEQDRRLADVREVEGLQPVRLTVSPGTERTICDERFWKYRFTVGRDPKAAVGFPVVSVTAPDEAAGYGKTDRAKLGRKVEGLLAERPEAVEEYAFEEPAGPAKNTRPDKIVGRVLYRGHEYQTTTPLKSAGIPVREVAYTPPAALLQNDRAVYCVVADPKAVSGGLTVLIDLTFSMNRDLKNPDDKNPAPRERAKLTAAMDALEEVLRGLPPDTQVTFAVFWGDENGNPTVKPVDGLAAPMRWIGGGDAKQRDEVMRVLRALPANGDTTPLAQSIQAVVRTDEKRFWPAPEAASGVRTLLVLTDGAEVSKLTEKGYTGPGPGRVVLDALLTAREEVSLHVLFFGVPTGERQLASEQFKVVESRTEFDRHGQPPRRPGVLYRDLTDKAELVGKMKEAMRPRVLYWKPDPDVRPVPSELEVTIPDEGRYRASPYLAAGEYELRGLQTPQALRLDPGDRVILKARQRGVRFDLFTPPAAYDAADGRWPRAAGTRVRMTVPQVKTANPAGAYDLAAVVTLESADDQPDKTLAQPRPDFTWFDVTGPGGEPLKTPIRVRNRAGLVAPAWDVELPRWCPSSVAQANIPRPVVSGYWLKSQPGAQNVTVNLTSPVREYKPVTPGGGKVDVVWIDVEKGDGSDGLPPAADFLTVRLEYPEDPARPDPVFVRPGRLKETAKLQQLTERHRYYDLGPGVRRYTAWFGPVTARDREQPIELEVYRVSDLKKQAQAGGWDVTLRYPDAARLHTDEPSPDLFLYPGK